jgi:hypothetical protein
MGLIRKATSVSTLGVVGYRSRGEAQKKAAVQEAKLAKVQRKALKDELRGQEKEEREAKAEQRETEAQGKPWYFQPTLRSMIATAAAQQEAKKHGEMDH